MGDCPCCGALVAEWLERAVAVQEVSGSSPGRGEHKKDLLDVGDLLITSFSAKLSKDRGSIYSIHTIQSQEQNNTLHAGTGSRHVSHSCPLYDMMRV